MRGPTKEKFEEYRRYEEYRATQVDVIPPDGYAQKVKIDKDLVPLITRLWSMGFRTRACCQGEKLRYESRKRPKAPTNPEIIEQGLGGGIGLDNTEAYAYIAFASRMEAVLFAAIAGPSGWSIQDIIHARKETLRLSKQWARTQCDEAASDGELHDAADSFLVEMVRRWLLENDVVRFPPEDINRALRALHAQVLTHIDQFGTYSLHMLPPSARRCRTCGELVTAKRKDAVYCSTECRNRARDRGHRRSSE